MKTIFKPWGKEEWLELNDRYCYKRIYINAGYKTSFQYHQYKIETNYIISGEAEVWLENDEGIVEKKTMRKGDFFNVEPPKKHRVIALTDIILQEVSTPEVDDVIRIEDDTNRIDGKIEGEHKNPAVLILTAGLGTRLGDLTKNVNKGLIPINNKGIISHIIDKFPNHYDFIVAVGHEKDSVINYCQIAHPNHNFEFVEIDNFDGKDSGPGYSSLKCKEHLQRPFYITTCDCIIDSKLPHLDGNWLGVQPTQYPEKYSTIAIDEQDNIVKFSNKSKSGYPFAFIGLASIWNYEVFWRELEKNIQDGELVTAFSIPENYPKIKVKKLKWLDTGNFDDLQKTKDYLQDKPLSLNKNNNEITYRVGERFLKFVPDPNILNRRVERAKILNSLLPNNFGSSGKFIFYDWQKGKTLYEIDDLFVYKSFLNLLGKNIEENHIGDEKQSENFYIKKTNQRLSSFVSKFGMRYFKSDHEINGKNRPSLEVLFNKMNFKKILSNPFYNKFHGDLQFDNIIYDDTNNTFKYIDWRDSFGDSVTSGDIYYDLSKLYGGLLIPYNIMKDESKISFKEGSYSISYSYTLPENLIKFRVIYENWILEKGFDLDKIKYITSLIFLNMSPLHDEKFGKMLWFKSIEMFDENDYR